jgi:hypothetical protein
LVSFSVVFDIVVKILASLLLVAGVLGMVGIAIYGWTIGPWLSALMWSLMTVVVIWGCGCMMNAAQEERRK